MKDLERNVLITMAAVFLPLLLVLVLIVVFGITQWGDYDKECKVRFGNEWHYRNTTPTGCVNTKGDIKYL